MPAAVPAGRLVVDEPAAAGDRPAVAEAVGGVGAVGSTGEIARIGNDELVGDALVGDADLTADDWTTAELERIAPGGTSEHGGGRFALPFARPTRSIVLEPTADGGPRERLLLRELGRAVRAGFEALVLSWLLVVVPVVAGYVATVASPVLGEASWFDAASGGTGVWLLGLGQPLTVLGAVGADDVDAAVGDVSLVPLGLTALTVWLLSGSVRRARLGSLPGILTALLSAGVVVAAAYAVAGSTPSGSGLARVAAVLAVGCLVGWVRTGGAPRPTLLRGVPEGLRAGRSALVVLLAVGLVLVLVAIAGSLSGIVELHRALGPDPLSAFLLVLAQLAALPTFAVWALAWLTGPGFSIGAVGVTPLGATEGPLPVLPVLAAVPEAGPGPGRWVGLAVVVVVTLALVRPLARTAQWREQLTTAGIAVGLLALAGGALAALSGGAVGPLSPVGTSGPVVGLGLAVLGAAGAVIAWAIGSALRRTGIDLAAVELPRPWRRRSVRRGAPSRSPMRRG